MDKAKARQPATDPARWVEDHGDALFRFALLRVRNRETAEELVQETLVGALAGRDRFTGEASERTWLTAILKRKVIDHFRAQVRKRGTAEVDLPPGEGPFDARGHWREPVADWRLDPARTAADAEFWRAFQQCLSKLSPTLADSFVLREIEGLGSDEICKVLTISASNLWTQLHRARMMLRQCLEKNWIRSER